MSDATQDRIVFEVETSRVLEILSKEIYDSPLALLRENLQNAYDAVLMRCTAQSQRFDEAVIDIRVDPFCLTIIDNGIGMTEDVLRHNFWKAGSSGKKTELAKRSGVIGTFGIGAMANFGVCTKLRVETRSIESDTTLISTAERSKLSISQECIELERRKDSRPPGTKLVAELDQGSSLAETTARNYLQPYVSYLPVKVLLNGQLISQRSYSEIIGIKGYQKLSEKPGSYGPYTADVKLYLDPNGQVGGHVTNVMIQGNEVTGELLLFQSGGQLMGLRNFFGLAPIPTGGHYQFGGYANLSILQPTAGREALSRESIEHVNQLVLMTELVISEAIAQTDAADRNNAFLQFLVSQGRLDLAHRVTIEVLPDGQSVPMSQVKDHCKGKRVYQYGGRDEKILQAFASAESCLLHVSQNNPRRRLQLRYVKEVLKIEEVPDRPTITREYKPTELTLEEASLLARVVAVLSNDYLLPDVEISFADISHGVTVVVSQEGGVVQIRLARTSIAIRPVLTTYRSAGEVFDGFVKDFVRNHLYQQLGPYIPSSTREGVDALVKLLQRNRELYRYEEDELGDLEPLLGDYLTGEKSLAEILVAAKTTVRPQTQTVRRDQVGSLEEAMPDVVQSPTAPEAQVTGEEYSPVPPIIRLDISCDLKILLTSAKYPQLNNFELFLGLSDRLFRREGDFFRYPHTTKVIWAGHRVIYIFTEASGRITLYYDIELREPLDQQTASGGMFPTTTLITKNRIYVPVPQLLDPAFRITEGTKEFYVRFDTI
jgi:molecular chaperone HtpG